MSTNRIKIQNAQFTLYYLMVSADGEITDKEKELFLNVVTKCGGFTHTYAESIFNGLHRFAGKLNYNFAIENLAQITIEEKLELVKILRELSFADGSYNKKELELTLKIKKDLNLM